MSARAVVVGGLVLGLTVPQAAASRAQAGTRQVPATSPLSVTVAGLPTGVRLGDEFSFVLKVRNTAASGGVDVPLSTRLALRRRGLTADLACLVSLSPADNRPRPIVFAYHTLAGSWADPGTIRRLASGDAVDITITTRLSLRSIEEQAALRPLLPASFQGAVLFTMAAVGAYLLLEGVGNWLKSRRRAIAGHSAGWVLAVLIAVGIGLHNFGEGLAIGYDRGDRVSAEYTSKFAFSGGQIIKVIYDIADDAYVDAERELAAALARD